MTVGILAIVRRLHRDPRARGRRGRHGDLHRLDPRHRRRLPRRRRLLGPLGRHAWSLRLIWAVLTVIVGVWLIVEPHNGTLTLTLVLGIYFLFMGLTRITVAFVGRGQQNAGLVGLSGVCGLLIGILVLAKFPSSRRLGDRPAGRHRPDLRRLDADSSLSATSRAASDEPLARTREQPDLCAALCERGIDPAEYDPRSELPPRPGHGGRRGHADAFLPAEGPAPRLRAADGRLADPGRARGRAPGGSRRSSRPAATSRPACPRASRPSSSPRPTAPAARSAPRRRWSTRARPVLVLSGDVPLISADDDRRRCSRPTPTAGAAATMLTIELDDPAAYGRVVRGADGEVERDRRGQGRRRRRRRASSRSARSTPASTSSTRRRCSARSPRLANDNAQGEYYLPDVLRRSCATPAARVAAHLADDPAVDARRQRPRRPRRGRGRGPPPHPRAPTCSPASPSSTPARPGSTPTSRSAPTPVIEPGTSLRGATAIGAGAVIGPQTTLIDSRDRRRRPRSSTPTWSSAEVARRLHGRPVRLPAPRRRARARAPRPAPSSRSRTPTSATGAKVPAPLLHRRRRRRRRAPTSAPARSPPTTTDSRKHRTDDRATVRGSALTRRSSRR